MNERLHLLRPLACDRLAPFAFPSSRGFAA
jgi:hypothetical protein